MYGTPLNSNQLDATASVPGSFAYNPTNGTLLNTGTNSLAVIFTPSDTVDYGSVTDSVSLVVTPLPLQVTASNASRQVSAANPAFKGSIKGLTNGDNITATYTTTATAGSPAGTYPITPTLADTNNRQTNYTVTLVNGTLTVTNASSYVSPYTFATLAGQPGVSGTNDGTGAAALMSHPNGVALDSAGNIYITDIDNEIIRLVTPEGMVTTLAGRDGVAGTNDGAGSAALFHTPLGVVVDSATNLYVSDYSSDTIRKASPVGTNWVVTTFAGQPGVAGTNDGLGSAAQFSNPNELAMDSAGNIYVADEGNETIRRITPAGMVSTLAGNPGIAGNSNGIGSAALFRTPSGVAVDSAGNVYVADWGNDMIRKLAPSGTNWVVSTLAGLAGTTGSADGTNTGARFYEPNDIAVDGASNLYVSDYLNNSIRRIEPVGTNWVVTTIGGLPGVYGTNDGTGSAARFDEPAGLAVDVNGVLYVADPSSDTIRKGYLPPFITASPASETVAAGYNLTLSVTAGGTGPLSYQWLFDGTNLNGATSSELTVSNVQQIDAGDYQVIVSSPYGSITNAAPAILVVEPALAVYTFAGLPGTNGAGSGVGTNAQFYYPTTLAMDASENLYIADADNNEIRYMTPAGVVSVLAGLAGVSGTNDGVGSAARFSGPNGVAVDGSGHVFVADTGNNTIREIMLVGTNWVVSTIAGSAGLTGTNDGAGHAARFNTTKGVAVDSGGNVYVADQINNTIRKLVPSGTNWTVSTLAGSPTVSGSANGTGAAARFNSPRNVATDAASNVYVADWNNYTVRKVTPAGVVSTLAGLAGNAGSADGIGGAARFYSPHGMAVDKATNVYVADFYNSTIRKITPAGVVTTVAGLPGSPGSVDGIGISAQLNDPCSLCCDKAGSNFFIADTSNHAIRKAVYDYGEPIVLQEPQSITAAVGGAVSFSAIASNSLSASYQWFFDGTNFADSDNPLFTVSNTQFSNAGNYGLIASNGVGATTNPIVTLAVVPLIINPQPASLTAVAGSNAAFSVGVSGLGPFSYQWQMGGTNLADNSRINGSQSNELAISNLAVADAGSYQVIVTNAYGAVTSTVATLGLLGTPVAFATNPGSIYYAHGLLTLQLTNLAGQGAILIEASTNLTAWVPIHTNPASFGAIQFTDSGASNYSQRYYRAVVSPQ